MRNSKIALFAIPAIVALMSISLLTTSIQTTPVSVPSFDDRSTVTGHVILQVFDTNTGELKYKVENHNLVVDVGLDEMAQATFGVGGVGTTNFDFIEIGTGAVAPTATDVALGISACARIQDVAPDVNSATSGETSVSVISSFDGATCAGAITEAGIFNAISANQMLARSTFGSVTISAGDTLNVNYTITIT